VYSLLYCSHKRIKKPKRELAAWKDRPYLKEYIMNELTAQELTQILKLHEQTMLLHIHALACHSECLGMNAENSFAVCLGIHPPYGDVSYLATMKKWKLINDKGEPIV
jgi:hypothetical protein